MNISKFKISVIWVNTPAGENTQNCKVSQTKGETEEMSRSCACSQFFFAEGHVQIKEGAGYLRGRVKKHRERENRGARNIQFTGLVGKMRVRGTAGDPDGCLVTLSQNLHQSAGYHQPGYGTIYFDLMRRCQ